MPSGRTRPRRWRDAAQMDGDCGPYRNARSVLQVRESLRSSPPSRCEQICACGASALLARRVESGGRRRRGAHLGDEVERELEEEVDAEGELVLGRTSRARLALALLGRALCARGREAVQGGVSLREPQRRAEGGDAPGSDASIAFFLPSSLVVRLFLLRPVDEGELASSVSSGSLSSARPAEGAGVSVGVALVLLRLAERRGGIARSSGAEASEEEEERGADENGSADGSVPTPTSSLCLADVPDKLTIPSEADLRISQPRGRVRPDEDRARALRSPARSS